MPSHVPALLDLTGIFGDYVFSAMKGMLLSLGVYMLCTHASHVYITRPYHILIELCDPRVSTFCPLNRAGIVAKIYAENRLILV